MSDRTFSIRPFLKEDVPDLVAVFRTLVPYFFGASEEQDLLDHLDQYGDTYYILEQEGIILGGGGIVLNEEAHRGRLSWTFLHEKAQGKGAGRALIEWLLDRLREESYISTVEVWTSQRTFAFFERFGFQNLEIKKNYWAPGLHLYRMERVG
jgi:ribosomal-protein-alanine N-acetyltransferase